MQATAPEIEQEFAPERDRALSLWFWIVPLLLVLGYVAFFAVHLRRPRPEPSASHAANTLPELGVVQFDRGSSTLTADGQATLDRAAEVMHGNPNVYLRLEGYDSPSVSPRKKDHPHNLLNVERTVAVQTYLDLKGVERTRIRGGQFRDHGAALAEAFPEAPVENRRAELYVQ